MIALEKIFVRAARWNAARYDREYNHELSVALLREEHTEWLEATELVDQLDALCDQIYVAMGVLWKLNIDEETNLYNANMAAGDVRKLIKTDTIMPGYLVSAVLSSYEHDSEYPVAYAMHMIIQCCLVQMGAMHLSHDDMKNAMNIVCDANDTKAVKKTASNVKANTDKGIDFISPEPRLQALLDKVTYL